MLVLILVFVLILVLMLVFALVDVLRVLRVLGVLDVLVLDEVQETELVQLDSGIWLLPLDKTILKSLGMLKSDRANDGIVRVAVGVKIFATLTPHFGTTPDGKS